MDDDCKNLQVPEASDRCSVVEKNRGDELKRNKIAVKYSPEIGNEICRRVSLGESLTTVCESDRNKYPDESAVRGWVVSGIGTFRETYLAACKTRAERWADEIATIADEPIERDSQGRGDFAAIQRQRLRVDTRKWLVQKMLPKVYGDRVEHTGTLGIQVITGVPRRDDDSNDSHEPNALPPAGGG